MSDYNVYTDDPSNNAGISDIAGFVNSAIKKIGGRIIRSIPPHIIAELKRQGQIHRSEKLNKLYEFIAAMDSQNSFHHHVDQAVRSEEKAGITTSTGTSRTAHRLWELANELQYVIRGYNRDLGGTLFQVVNTLIGINHDEKVA